MNRMTYIGIDPGLDGAIAFISEASISIYPVPTIKSGKTGKRFYDPQVMRDLIGVPDEDNPLCACLELVHAFPGQGVSSMFNFGMGFGIWQGLLTGLKIPYMLVQPQTWQKEMLAGCNKGDPKAAALLVGKRLFPAIEFRKSERSRKPHQGMIDALLIAEFCRRTIK